MNTRTIITVLLTLAATFLTLQAAAQDLSQVKVTLRLKHNLRLSDEALQRSQTFDL